MSNSKDRFEGMTQDLMRDLFEVLVDPEAVAAILEAPAVEQVEAHLDANDEVVYELEVEGKRYTAGALSRSRSRNVLMLNQALKDILAGVEGARAMAHAIIDAL